MIANQARTFTVSIDPGQTMPIDMSGSYIKVLSNSTSNDLIVSFDYGLATELAEGVGIPTVKFSANRKTLIPAVFQSIQLTNPSQTEVMTVRVSVSLGTPSDARSFVQGSIMVDAAGIPDPAGMLLADTVTGLTVVCGKYTREVIFDVDATAPVIVYSGGKRIARLKADSMSTLTVRNCTLTVKGDGANAYVAITRNEGQ